MATGNLKRSILCAASLLVSVSATAKDVTRKLLAPEESHADVERVAIVGVAPGALVARTNQLGLTSVTGGGLLSALVDSGINESRQREANEKFSKIGTALADYDISLKAMDASKKLFERVQWLRLKQQKSVEGDSDEELNKIFSANTSAQVLTLDYELNMEPGFKSIRVSVLVRIMGSDGKKYKPRYLQNFICFVPLRDELGDASQNATRWSENSAQLVRDSIDLALEKLVALAARGLELTKEEAATIKSLKGYRVGYSQKKVENWYGKIVQKDDTGTLLETQFGEWIYYFWPTQESKGTI